MGVGETDNLTELENLTEETLLQELQVRYERDCIYTYVGEILVAVNPFKMIDGLYTESMTAKYTQFGDRSALPPHLFAVADTAFCAMRDNPPGKIANQVAVISGESGAGKTESAKLFMKHIINLSLTLGRATTRESEHGAHGLEEKIVQLNPLLESFGNAQTLMNDNSSRFGKFTELRFNPDLQVEGALMYEYLLEKSRVVAQGDGERNFHVFYLFFAGNPDADKYLISDPSEHRLINGNEDALSDINGPKYKEMWRELDDCIQQVGFTPEEQEQMFHILAGILHTGDVEIGGDDSAYIVADDVLTKVATQLGVEMEALKAALTTSVNITRGETIARDYKNYEAEDCRDAMAKALYGKTFSWIVKRVNLLLGPKGKQGPNDKTIGILDIFGFECFESNSFEQLLINLANEQLQWFFNNHIFKMELDEYAKEGIDGSAIKFEDNQECLDMLLNKPVGLLAICDEEAAFPKGSDKTMVEKTHAALAGLKGYEKPRGNEVKFSIAHYAGLVEYQAEGFLEKNRDNLAIDVVGVMRLSTNSLVRELFGGDAEDAKTARQKKVGGKDEVKKKMRMSMKKAHKAQAKTKKTSVGFAFKKSLNELMKNMSEASPHFVRCIKPNHLKVPGNFSDELVTKQLRYTGMLETTRIRKEGYSQRPTFQDFVNRYKVIAFPFSANPPPNPQTCSKICDKAGITGWQVGKTKVFLRYFHADGLSKALLPFPTAATKLSKVAKGLVARKKFKRMNDAAVEMRKSVKSFLHKFEKNMEDTVVVMQSLVEEDAKRPADFFQQAEPKDEFGNVQDKEMKKFIKKAGKDIKKAGGISRAASVRWFKEVEMKKGAGLNDTGTKGFAEWFHGVITRKQSEDLLESKAAGTFLVRVSESRFGYSLSHMVTPGERIKHYMIDQTPDGQYQVVGNSKLFPSLNSLVSYHKTHKIVASDPVALVHPCGQVAGHDDLAEFVDKKTKKLLE
eukprot:m.130293 g.130293  ORF g.130293 m.130293 type:complete len:964 (-) comp16784_c0_seq1:1942-4833(-)